MAAAPRLPTDQEVLDALVIERDGLRRIPKSHLRRLSRLLDYLIFSYRLGGDGGIANGGDGVLYNSGYRAGSVEALQALKLPIDLIIDGTYQPSTPDEEGDEDGRARAEFFDE